MGQHIKLIWDFRGTVAIQTAIHHEKHLREYIRIEKLPLEITGHKIVDDSYAYAFMVVEEKDMIAVRDVLKPHRGEIYQE
ncbi:hypothetical protein G4D82_04065 [Flavobacterium sp. CYK-4]|uniref:hypothetical protein n=1 Tax=Flavobacterium lotistagni TaxID=2709660 RepID=UPI001409EAB0|nr:hypothetical protein [Flavobacterium lotistagni]NHM06385.1 hypothetical protein [Flavobacterium lotistagni]